MKKNIFPVWLKELCSLVFTQSVQAFLLAIVMSVILSMASDASTAEAGTSVSATGVIAIVALTAISKVELIVKKIFGIESQFGDPSMKSGAAGLAGTLIGARLAGRVLNNAGKVAGGAGDILKARGARAAANARLANSLNKLKASSPDQAGAGAPAGVDAQTINPAAPQVGEVGAPGIGTAAGVGAAAGAGMAAPMGGATNLNPGTLNINAGNVKLDGKNIDADKYQDKKEAIMQKYNDEIEKAKEQRREGAYKMISGLTETAGAIPGAAAGAIYGMATGDGIAKNAGVGMGIGDYLGEMAAAAPHAVHNTAINISNTTKATDSAKSAVKELTGKDITSYKSSIKELDKYVQRLDSANDNAQRQVDAGNM